MHVGPTQFLGSHFFTGRGFNQWRTAQKSRALVANDYRFVAHCRNVCPAGSTRTHDCGDLVDPGSRHGGLVIKNPSEVFAVRKHFRLKWEEGPAGVHEINTRKIVLYGDFLRPKVLLHRDWKIRPAFNG